MLCHFVGSGLADHRPRCRQVRPSRREPLASCAGNLPGQGRRARPAGGVSSEQSVSHTGRTVSGSRQQPWRYTSKRFASWYLAACTGLCDGMMHNPSGVQHASSALWKIHQGASRGPIQAPALQNTGYTAEQTIHLFSYPRIPPAERFPHVNIHTGIAGRA